jgi:hypothetical protein
MSQAAAASSAINGGGNPLNPAMGANNAAVRLAIEQARQKSSAGASSKPGFGGSGMVQRIGNLESRLDAIEKAGKDPVKSVQPIQKFVTGGSFSEAPSTSPAPVATGTLSAAASPGSLEEAMPSPGDPASDMFGNEFMRNASVGAAKMRINKKL